MVNIVKNVHIKKQNNLPMLVSFKCKFNLLFVMSMKLSGDMDMFNGAIAPPNMRKFITILSIYKLLLQYLYNKIRHSIDNTTSQRQISVQQNKTFYK